MSFRELIGKRVQKLYIDSDKQTLSFVTDQGLQIYSALGDCCSDSWFEHLSGVKDILGKVITGVTEIECAEVMGTKQEVDRVYSYKFTLGEEAVGRFEVEMRNSSNGYYGGSVEISVNDPLFKGEEVVGQDELKDDI